MDYMLNIKVPFSAMDDIAAREKTKEIYNYAGIITGNLPDGTVTKLQRLEQGKAPTGISLEVIPEQPVQPNVVVA